MTTHDSKIQIHHAVNPSELAAGLAFVDHHYQKAFGVIPSPPDHLLVAQRDSHIVGTIGVNVWHEEMGLRLATVYQFDPSRSPVPIDLPHSVEFGRWACDSSGVACALLHAATCFALEHGARYVLCEHSRAVNRVCQKYGIVFYPITDAIIIREEIEEHHRPFYDSTDAHLYLFRLDKAQIALAAYLEAHAQ